MEESMNKWTSALVGAIVGAGASTLFLYLFAPARGTSFDEKYQSRLDWALAEGDKAAKEREQELLHELDEARNPKPSSSPLPDLQAPEAS
jgi:hypothetical protein